MRNGRGEGQKRAEQRGEDAMEPAAAEDDSRCFVHGLHAHALGDHVATIWRLLRAMNVSPEHSLRACVRAIERVASNHVVVTSEQTLGGIPIQHVVDPLLLAAFRAARSQWQSRLPDNEAGSSSVRNQGELLVLGLLGSLDEPKRVILLLADMERLSSPEIAALMGLRLDVVYDELRKARKMFVRARSRFDHANATGDAEVEARELLTLARTWFSPDAAAQSAVSQQLRTRR